MKIYDMKIKSKYDLGDIVTLNSHPLLRSNSKIIEFPAQVPPLMMVKEVYFEDDKKKKLFSEELGEKFRISDNIKYTCTYFSANKSEFVDIVIYESFLSLYDQLKYHRVITDEKNKKIDIDKQLIPEVKKYLPIDTYNFGKVIQFKTKKLEQRKSYDSSFEKVAHNSFQSPDFIISGIKNENVTDLFYHDGSPKRKVYNEFYKVLWFNHVQQKNNEHYLPKDFFVENIPFN